jgi:hypothetical protein
MMAKKKGKERVENMVAVLREWQGIERQAVNDLSEIMEKTANPLIRIIMEIIRHDSLMHHRVQQFLVDSVTVAAPAVTREDVAEIWGMVEEHDRAEKKTIELARGLLEDAWTPVQKQLLDYLLKDETKHDVLLMQLDELKKGMSRASGA